MDKESNLKNYVKRGVTHAFSAYVEIIECDVASVALKPGDAEVIVYIVEDRVSLAALQQKVTELNMIHHDYVSEAANLNDYNIIIVKKCDQLVKG